jgi:hypothetical protein
MYTGNLTERSFAMDIIEKSIVFLIVILGIVSSSYSDNSNTIPHGLIFSSTNLKLSVTYPYGWQHKETSSSVVIKSKEVIESERKSGAEIIVSLLGPVDDKNTPLKTVWKFIPDFFSEVKFEQPVSITINGKQALRAVFSDQRDNTQGWTILTMQDGYRYLIITQVFKAADWEVYEDTFRAIVNTFHPIN